MKKQLFGKRTALVMGSLVLFSVQGLAISSNNNQELSNVDASGKSEPIVAQATDRLSPPELIDLSQSIAAAASSVSNAVAAASSAAIPTEEKVAITNSLSKASMILGGSLAQSQSDTLIRSEAEAIDNSIFQAFSLINDATSIAQSVSSIPGALDLLNLLNQASRDTADTGVVAAAMHGGSGRRYRR